MEKSLFITTTDNPFDPSTQWEDWYYYDLSQGYCSCERLAKLAKTSDELSDEVNAILLEDQLIEVYGRGYILEK